MSNVPNVLDEELRAGFCLVNIVQNAGILAERLFVVCICRTVRVSRVFHKSVATQCSIRLTGEILIHTTTEMGVLCGRQYSTQHFVFGVLTFEYTPTWSSRNKKTENAYGVQLYKISV